MREIDTVYMLTREHRGKLGILYHRPGSTSKEAWDYACQEWHSSYVEPEKVLRIQGWRARRVKIYSID